MESSTSSDNTPPPVKHRKRISGDPRSSSASSQHHHLHTKRRSKDVVPSSSRELARLLVLEEREIKELQHALFAMTEQLKMERQRADDADRKALEAAHRYRHADNARIAAELNSTRANEELRLYKIQLENAQKEIFRAQEVISDVESQRHEAEADAARSRSTARALKEEKLVQSAREEGRRLGMQEGMERGRDLGYQEGRAHGYEQGRERAEHIIERVYYDEEDEDTERERDDRRSEANTEPRWERSERSERRYDPRHERNRERDRGRGRGGPSYDPRRDRFEKEPRSESTHTHTHTHSRPPTVVIPETPVHSAPPSPRRERERDVPPDNWIPDRDADARIRLPPPHEMHRPPVSRSPSPPLPPVPEEEEPVLMIPAPDFEIETPQRITRHRRRSSSPTSESSGRTSELDLLNAPRQFAGRGYTDRLSVIREANSAENTPSQQTLRTASTPTVGAQASIRETPPRYVQPQTPRMTDFYRRPRSPDGQSVGPSMPVPISMPMPVPSTLAEPVMERRASTSTMNSEIGINVEPPSRPQSNSSRENATGVTSLLSPRDADRPIPLPGDRPPTSSGQRERERSSIYAPPVIPSGSASIVAQLPPGFVATGPPVPDIPLPPSSRPPPNTHVYSTPSSSRPPPNSHSHSHSTSSSRAPTTGHGYTTPRHSIYGPPASTSSHYTPAAPVIPGGFPPMGDQYMSMSTHGSYRTLDRDMDMMDDPDTPMPTTMPVIPPPSANYPHYDDDAQTTSSSSANTLSTPPPRRMRIGRRSSSDYYETAPVPVPGPGMGYAAAEGNMLPVPPPVGTPRHVYQATPASTTRAGSRLGSATPRTRPISIYGAAATVGSGDGGHQGVRSSESKPSLHSSGSHKHFDREGYLDPAFLASASSSVEDVNEVGMGHGNGHGGHGSGRSRR